MYPKLLILKRETFYVQYMSTSTAALESELP